MTHRIFPEPLAFGSFGHDHVLLHAHVEAGGEPAKNVEVRVHG